jgi:hypothetical protein
MRGAPAGDDIVTFNNLMLAAKEPLACKSLTMLRYWAFAGFHELVGDVRRSAAAMRRIAADSYYHPNGFAKIQLVNSGDWGPKLRLHVWCADLGCSTHGSEDIHDHFWDFSSAVVAGKLLAETYICEAAPAKGTERLQHYELVRGVGGRHGLRRVGAASLKRISSRHFTAGQIHGLRAKALHRIEPLDNKVTATLVLQGPHQPIVNRVFRRAGSARRGAQGDIHPLSTFELRQLLDLAREAGPCLTTKLDRTPSKAI